MNNINSEDIILQAPVCLFWKNTKSVFLGCNDAFAKEVGLNTPQEIIGKTDYDMPWAEEFAEIYRLADQEVLDGLPKHNQSEPQKLADGKLITVIYSKITLLDKHNQTIGTIGNFIKSPHKDEFASHRPLHKDIPLPPRQAECLALLACGMSMKQIARAMQVSSRTVETHLNNIKIKLQCANKSALIAKALTFEFIHQQLERRGIK